MFYTAIIALCSFSRLISASQLEGRQTANNCSDIHIVTARASTEQPGEGVIGSLAKLIQDNNQGVTRDNVQYPATLKEYASSSSKGTAALTKQLTNYTEACPNSKVVLLGYSQGAHVIGDVMCGGGEAPGLGPSTPPIDAAVGEKVVAIIQMGDPRALVNQTQDVGNATRNGVFPRQQNQLCTSIASNIKSYCDAGDPFCASGGNVEVHLGYTQEYNGQALAFVNEKLKSASSSSASASSTASAQASKTAANSAASGSSGATGPGVPRSIPAGLTGASTLLGILLCL